VLIADSADEVSRALHRDQKVVVSIREEPEVILGGAVATTGRRRKVNKDDVIFFAHQLAVMVDTGVPLAEAIDAVAEQTEQMALKVMLRDISDQVKGGVEFSGALEKYPKVFSRLFVSMMRASEASGTMGKMLVRVSEYISDERDTRKKVRGAMIYPVCMLGFCVLVVVALLTFVLPRFEKIYAGRSVALPAPTRVLLAISGGIVTYWPIILTALFAAGAAVYMYLRTPAGRLMTDKLRISAPIIGPMYRKAYLARSLRTMSTMIGSGVSMLESLAITAQVAGNRFYERIWTNLADRVKEGFTLAEPLFGCSLIPRTVTQMISAGERTGKLSRVMDRVAQFCEDDLRVEIKSVTQMIEPIMIVVMGLIIGGIAIALLLPVFTMSSVVAR
jgi:type IV pilus assembly protein PilC